MTARLAYFDCWVNPVADDVLRPHADIVAVRLDQKAAPEDSLAALAGAHGYHLMPKTELNPRWWLGPELIAECKTLLAASSTGAGYDHIDVDACTEAGILVVNNSGTNSDSVAQHAIGMMLALSKNMIRLDRMMRREAGVERMRYPGREVTGKTLGIIGLGNIGRRTAKIARHALGMRVIAHDPYIRDRDFIERDAEKSDFKTVFRTSDVVTVHCPLTDETRGMIGAEAFALMRPQSLFINTARGGIHSEADLTMALATGRIDGAGIDVFDVEPPGPGHPLMAFDNVVLSPHVAGITDVCTYKMAEGGARQWVDILSGKRPPRVVNPDVWPHYRQRFREILGIEVEDA